MGFSLYLYKIDGDRLVEPDHDGLKAFCSRTSSPSTAERSFRRYSPAGSRASSTGASEPSPSWD
jgi:hypothetical protein